MDNLNKIQVVTIKKILPNPNNPRIIKDDNFKKLVKSIKDFPEMLQIRPIIVNSEFMILGGNMRLKACIEAGLKEVPIILADKFTEKQQREFIIKDNVGYGEWDWETLANEWDTDDLNDWGFDMPKWLNDDEKEPDFDLSPIDKGMDTYLNNKIKQITLFLSSEQYEDTINKLDRLMDEKGFDSNTEAILYLINKYYERDIS